MTETIRLKKIDTGLYLHEPTGWLVVKDGYSSPREAVSAFKQENGFDARLKGFRFDGMEYEPEEICWVVVDERDMNIDITDTLRQARAAIAREMPKAAATAAGRFIAKAAAA